MTTTQAESTATVHPARLVTYGAIAAVVASGVNAIVRGIAVTLFDVPTGFEPLAWAPVVNTTVVGVVGATVAYGLLLRRSTRPNRSFLAAAIVVLGLSFVPLLVPPAFLAGAPASVLGTLAVMHVTTAAVAVGVLLAAGTDGGRVR